MKGRSRLLCVLLLISVLATMGQNVVYADTITQKKSELNTVQDQIEEKKDLVDTITQQQTVVSNDIENLDNIISQAESEIEKLSGDISLKGEELKRLKKDIEVLNVQTEAYVKERDQRMVELYNNGGIIESNAMLFFNAIFSGKGFFGVINNITAAKSITEHDAEVIKKAGEYIQSLNQKKASLETEQKKLDQLNVQQKTKQQYLENQMDKKNEYLDQLASQKELTQKAIDELEKTSRELTTLIKKLQSQSSGTNYVGLKPSKGIFGMPTNGRLTSPFGYRIHPIFKTKSFHTGIDLANSSGTPIYASQAGKVIYSGTAGGYGQTVIIDHGNGWTTLYAHNSSILVSVGQTVSKGQQVSKMGSTGNSTGPHLHFEVRKDGEPQNPLNYL